MFYTFPAISLIVSLKDALLGFETSITHLDKREVPITASGVVQPFTVIRLPGEGMPQHGTPSIRGDLYVKVNVKMPEILTSAQQQAIEKLLV